LAPKGWHIPSNEEWNKLVEFLGGEEEAESKLKDTIGWIEYGCQGCDGGSEEFKKICPDCRGTQKNSKNPINANGTNKSGFSALPGGYSASNFHRLGEVGAWWTNSSNRFLIISDYVVLFDHTVFTDQIYSVRCIKD